MAQLAHRIAYPRLSVLPEGEAARERMAAVIDLGSNSWRLVVFAYLPGASWRRVGQLQEPVRIAEDLSRSGSLKAAATSPMICQRCRAMYSSIARSQTPAA